MKNNSAFCVLNLLILSIHLFASASESNNSALSSPKAKRFHEVATQTEISACDDEQVMSRVKSIADNADKTIVKIIEPKLSELKIEAAGGSVMHAAALKRLIGMLGDEDYMVLVEENEPIFPILKETGLLEKPSEMRLHIIGVDKDEKKMFDHAWMINAEIAMACQKEKVVDKWD